MANEYTVTVGDVEYTVSINDEEKTVRYKSDGAVQLAMPFEVQQRIIEQKKDLTDEDFKKKLQNEFELYIDQLYSDELFSVAGSQEDEEDMSLYSDELFSVAGSQEDEEDMSLYSEESQGSDMTNESNGSVESQPGAAAPSLVKYDNNGRPIRPAPPSLSAMNEDKGAMARYAEEKAAYDIANAAWNAQPARLSNVTLASSNTSFTDIGHNAITQLNETQQEIQAEQQSAFNRWVIRPLNIRKMTQEEKLQQDIETMINHDDIVVFQGQSGSPRTYKINIPTIGELTGEIPSNVDVGDSEALKAVVVADFKEKFIEGENVIPPINFSDPDVMAGYMEQMRAINEAAYEINKPAILRNEGFFGRLGDLASRDRADKSYKDQFKELVPEQMRKAFLVRRVTVGVAGIDQKTIEMKDLPDYYKAQIKSKKSQLIGISKAAGGTSVEDYNELKAQIEDCKVMERSWRIIVDAAHDPRINSAQFFDMQKACMEDISKRMEAAGRRYQAFKEGITIKNTAIALGSTGALATAGYFMYGWINSGAATANAISDLAAIEAWFQGAGATMGSGFATAGSWFTGAGSTMGSWSTGAGSTMGSWFTGAGSTMGSGTVGGAATVGAWLTSTGLTIETGLISAGLLTAAGALTATGIGAVVVLGVGMITAIDHFANDGKLRKAVVQGILDFYKATAGLVSSVAKNVNHQIQQVRLERGHYKPGTKNLFLEEGHEKAFEAVEDAVLSGIVALRVSNIRASENLDLLHSISPKLDSAFAEAEYEATRKHQKINQPIEAHNDKPHVYRVGEDGLFIAPKGHDKMKKELVSEHLVFLKKALDKLDRILIEHHGEISYETTDQINVLRKSLQREIKIADLSLKALTYGIAETAVKDAVKRVVLGGISKARVQANLDYAREKVVNLASKVSEVEKDVKAKSKAEVGAKLLLAAAVETLREAESKLQASPEDAELKGIMKAEQHKHKKATQRLSTAKQNLEQAKRSLSGLEKDMRKAVTEVSKLEKELVAPTRGERARAAGTSARQAIVGLTLEEAQAEVDDLNKQIRQNQAGGDQPHNPELEVLERALAAAKNRRDKLQSKDQAPSFFQSFKESWDLDAAGTIAKLKKTEAMHEKVQESLRNPELSDELKRANQREARTLRMEIRNLICQLEAKGKFDAAYGSGNLPVDEQMLIDIKDEMIAEAEADIAELTTNELMPVDKLYNARKPLPWSQERIDASQAELNSLQQELQSLKDNRQVIVDRQAAKASEKESQAGFLKGMSEALSTWWAKPWFERSVAAEREEVHAEEEVEVNMTRSSDRAWVDQPYTEDGDDLVRDYRGDKSWPDGGASVASDLTEDSEYQIDVSQSKTESTPQATEQRDLMNRFKSFIGLRKPEPTLEDKLQEAQTDLAKAQAVRNNPPESVTMDQAEAAVSNAQTQVDELIQLISDRDNNKPSNVV